MNVGISDLTSERYVAARLQRPLTDFEADSLESLAEQLYPVAANRVPDLLQRCAIDPGYLEGVQAAFSGAIARHLRNPRSITYENEGGYSYGTTSSETEDPLRFTDQEWKLIVGTASALGSFIPGGGRSRYTGSNWHWPPHEVGSYKGYIAEDGTFAPANAEPFQYDLPPFAGTRLADSRFKRW